MAELILDGLKKSYGETRVLERVDLKVPDGEFLVLVGPSGCGKSTLLRCIAGLETITEGSLSIGDRVVNDLPPKARDIAMVFQSYALYPHMTVRANMAFGLKLRGMPASEIETRVREAAGLLDLDALLDRLPKQLSGGQRQRVAMGRAIVRRPSVFLFDEPLSNLDAKLRVQMRAELARLHQRLGTTMVYVTHDQVEAMTLADRIVVLEGGRVQQVGAPLELYHRPVNKFVAGFIGSPAMNFLDGRLVGQEEDGAGRLDISGSIHHLVPGRALPAIGQHVTVGVRPEHVEVSIVSTDPGAPAVVEVVEPLGWATHLHLVMGEGERESRLVVEAPSERVGRLAPGAQVRLTLPPDSLHLFDIDSGKAIGQAEPASAPTVQVPIKSGETATGETTA